MENSVIIRSQIVEAQVVGTPATGRRYNFLEVPNLSRNNIVCYAIETIGYTQLVATPNGNTTIGGGGTTDVSDQFVVTLLDDKKNEFVYQMPAYSMVRANNGGFLTFLKPRILNLTDCYIQLTNTTNVAASEVAVFNLYYYYAK